MTEEERQFHIREGREINNCRVYAYLFGYDDDPLFWYMDSPVAVLGYMGWPKLEGTE